jgi:N-terminal acetyltransferase B complex non-catalytic subunit
MIILIAAQNGWLCIMKICSAVADLLDEEYHEPQSIQQKDVQELAAALKDLPELLKAAHNELTETEINNCNRQFYIGKALTLHLQQASPTSSTADSNKADFDRAIQSLQDWLTETANTITEQPFNHGEISISESPIAPSWQYLHSAFSTLDSLQMVSLFLAGQSKASKTKSKAKNPYILSADQRKDLKDSSEQIEKNIHDSARRLKDNLNASGVLGRMIDAVFGRGGLEGAGGGAAFGRALEKLPDAEAVAERFCGEVRGSWEDALDGVVGIRVKRYK